MKSTKVVVAQRVSEVFGLRLGGAEFADIREYAAAPERACQTALPRRRGRRVGLEAGLPALGCPAGPGRRLVRGPAPRRAGPDRRPGRPLRAVPGHGRRGPGAALAGQAAAGGVAAPVLPPGEAPPPPPAPRPAHPASPG